MTDDTIHPVTGADDEESQKIWDDLNKADAAEAANAEIEADPTPPADQPPADASADAPADTSDPAPPADKAAGDAATPDTWANATPEQRAAYDAATRKLNETNELYRRSAGTVSGLQRKINALEAQLGGKPQPKAGDKPGDTPKDEKKPTSILDDPRLKKVGDEYPEVIGPLMEIFAESEKRTETLARKLDGMAAESRGRHIDDQVEFVLSQHPDYGNLRKSKEFKAWREQAPAFVHDAIGRNAQEVVDGQEVAAVIEMFKLQTGYGRSPAKPPASTPAPGTTQPAVSDKRKAQLESAAAPRGSAPAPRTGQPETDEEWWKHFEEQDRKAARR
jgi:hypothetical protein